MSEIKIGRKAAGGGFTLPSVLIASIILLGLLALALQLSSAASNALKEQYYNQLAREASEAGIARANACASSNNSLAQWTDAKKLKANTNCSGDVITGQAAHVMSNDNIRTSFEVSEPVRTAGSLQRLSVLGRTELVRPDGTVFKTYTYQSSSVMGANTLISEVAFGYTGHLSCSPSAHFTIIDENNEVKSAGANNCGQLGNGTLNNSTTLTRFRLPAGKVANKVYTSFRGEGRNTFVLTTEGELYGAGYNEDGELGNNRNDFYEDWHGHISESNPQRFNMDAHAPDNKIVHVIPHGYATFVITEQGNVYVSGYNGWGSLGLGYTNNNTYTDLPQKITIPGGEKLLMTDGAWATKSRYYDRLATFIITESGKVYAWGDNSYGSMGLGDRTHRNVPTKIGNFGEGGMPKAKQVAYDGKTSYILDENGDVYSAGHNNFGQTGSRSSMLNNRGRCLTALGTYVRLQTCNPSDNRQWWEYAANGTLVVAGNPANSSRRCLRSRNDDWRYVEMASCNSSDIRQKFGPVLYRGAGPENSDDDYTFIRQTGWTDDFYCLYESLSYAGELYLESCSSPLQYYWWPYVPKLQKVNFPGGKKVDRITTDLYFATAVMTDGTVYSWGMNNGALGDNKAININNLTAYSKDIINWDPVEFKLPSGVKAVSSWTASNGYDPDKSNIFIVGDNCKVYGTGGNNYGQLGIGVIGGVRNSPQEMKTIGFAGNGCAAQVRAGYGTTVIYTSNRKVFTAGNNQFGQLGDGTTVNSATPEARSFVNTTRRTLLY